MLNEAVMYVRLRGQRGAVLFISLGIMVILLSLGLMFAAVTTSKQVITSNQNDALQARCIAESGIAEVMSRLATNPGWRGSIAEDDFGGGSYKVNASSLSGEEVLVEAVGMHGEGTHKTQVTVEIPPSSGSVYAWALREGIPSYSWSYSYRAHDDARGGNGYGALIEDGQEDVQGLTGFRAESVPYPIVKVEFVIYYYIQNDLEKGHLEILWKRMPDNKKCSWQKFEIDDLNNVDGTRHQLLAIDITHKPPPEGWNWSYFTSNPDFQIEIMQKEFDDLDKIWIDCAGFRITW